MSLKNIWTELTQWVSFGQMIQIALILFVLFNGISLTTTVKTPLCPVPIEGYTIETKEQTYYLFNDTLVSSQDHGRYTTQTTDTD